MVSRVKRKHVSLKLYDTPRGNLLPGAAHIVFDKQRLRFSCSQRIKDDISKTTASLTQSLRQASGLDATKLSK